MKIKEPAEGFATALVIMLLVIVAIGLGGWWLTSSNKSEPSKPNTNTNNTQQQTDVYAGWKTYENSKYGFSFKYPSSWKVEEVAIETPSGADPEEFAANLRFDVNEKYSEAGAFEIHVNSLAIVIDFFDRNFAQSSLNKIEKTEEPLKGKQSVQYKVTNSGIVTKQYLFSAGNKTYSFHSINEELNQQRSSSYWSDFEKVFDSLTIN